MGFKCKWIDHRNRMKSYTKANMTYGRTIFKDAKECTPHIKFVFVVDEGHSRGISIIFILKGLSKIFFWLKEIRAWEKL